MDEKKHILIVDDDEGARESLSFILENKGYKTKTAKTGQEALEKARENFFNLALLDIKLPDMKGVERLAPLKKMHPGLAAIMVTAYASLETAIQALNEGASAYITKPLNIDEVMVTIREALEKQRLVIENRRLYKALRLGQERYALATRAAKVGVWDWNIQSGDYMGDQPELRVEIGTRRDETETVVYVRDNGIGINPRYHDRIFDLFDKLDPRSEGAGVGLTIVKRIVKVHGERVWVESEGQGQGSASCFSLAGE